MARVKDLPTVCFCSGGKDSVTTLILCYEHGEPLDEVVYAEVMYNKDVSGEHPEHSNFIHNTLKPWVENNLGVPFTIVHSEKTYVEFFKHRISRGPNKGRVHGYPQRGMCSINRDCKSAPMNRYIAEKYPGGFKSYKGIAADEPDRLARLSPNDRSLLAEYGVTEAKAFKMAKKYGLLSPIYDFASRNGCWFCMNQKLPELAHTINVNPRLINKLMGLECYAAKKDAAYKGFKDQHNLKHWIDRAKKLGAVIGRPIWVDLGSLEE